MNAIQAQLAQGNTFPDLPVRSAVFGRAPAPEQAFPKCTPGAIPSLTGDGVQSLGFFNPTDSGTTSGSSQQGGFFGLIQNLIGRLDSYIQSLGGGGTSPVGAPSGGTPTGAGSNVAVPGEVYLA
jgi:hypothetical protein